jgi:DNA polymerase III subunit delta
MAAKKTNPVPEIRSIYVIAGKDTFRVRRQVESLLDRLLEPEQRGLALYQPKIQEATAAGVFDELRTLPFLAPRRVVLLEEAELFLRSDNEESGNESEKPSSRSSKGVPSKKGVHIRKSPPTNREMLERYFDAPSPCGVLILTVKSWPSNTKLAKKLPAVGDLIEISELKRYQLPGFVVQCARDEFKKTIAMEAAELLVEWVGDETGALHSEVEKLAVYVDRKAAITVEDVESLTGHNRVLGAFDVIDKLAARNLSGALDALRQMFEADKSAEYTVVGAFAYHLRQLIPVRALQDQGLSQEQIGRQLRLYDKRVASLYRQATQTDIRTLGGLLCDLARLDYAGKSGRAQISTAMEQWVIQLSGRMG